MTFWRKLVVAWRQAHPLSKFGLISFLPFHILAFYVLLATPGALRHSPGYFREQEIAIFGQSISLMLISIGWALRSRR